MNTPETIRARYPQFGDMRIFPNDLIDAVIVDSIIDMGDDKSRWGEHYDAAQAALVAHYLIVEASQRAGDSTTFKDTTSASAGGVSVSYSQSGSAAVESVSATSYGQRYLKIRTMYFSGPVVF